MSKKRNQEQQQKGEPFEFKFDFGTGGAAPGLGSLAGQPGVLQAINSLIGRDSGLMDTLPEPMKRRIWGLKFLHSQYLDLESNFKKELRALEEKYDKLYEPLFDKRANIVQGQQEPTNEEVEAGRPKEDEEAEKGEKAPVEESKEAVINADHGFPEDAKGIPHFWLGAMSNLELLSRMISERDEKLLQSLNDIKVKNMESPDNGFILEFYFSENEFITDAVLRKSYFLAEDDEQGEIVFDHSEGTTINWKPNQNLTVKRVTKNAGGGKRGRGRGKRGGRGAPQQKVVVEEPCESFFNFFTPPEVPKSDEELDEEMGMALRAALEDDYDVGITIKEQLIKRAVLWYTGEAIGDDDYEFDEDDDEDIDDDDESRDDDEDGDAGHPHQAEQPPDCKQQ